MKKTAITLLLAGFTASAGAQTMYDALNFSRSNYVGTARTVAMGNAFTALGGDLGAVTINPAGSAVARYSQVTVTPGISISVNTATGTSGDGFEKNMRTGMTRFAMPNFGFSINFDTHRNSGLKNWALGFTANMTDSYQNDMVASGTNRTTSLAGAIATLANGYEVDALAATDAYDMIPVRDWRAIIGLQSHMIGLVPTLPGQPEDQAPTNEYIGVTENPELSGDQSYYDIGVGGPLDQTFARRTTGSRYDYVINFGANFSDIVFIGANLGITSLNYGHQYYIRETSQDSDFFETGFNSLRYSYSYNATGTGVYGKFGVIVLPAAGLRLGAAVQTPTAVTISESWQFSAEQTSYNSDSGSESSPLGEYRYGLVSPFRFNVGAAYTFGNIGLISLDYEMCSYGSARFREIGTNDNSAFEAVNSDIRTVLDSSHELRAGVEVKPVQALAIRAGYNFSTSPIPSDIDYENQYLWERTDSKHSNLHSVALGLGYSSKGSFFADIAARMTKYADTYVYPYEYYTYDSEWNQYVNTDIPTPEIRTRRTLWNVLLTIGFRF